MPGTRRKVYRILLSKGHIAQLCSSLQPLHVPACSHTDADSMADKVGFSLKMNISTSLLYVTISQYPLNQNVSPPSTHHSTEQKKYGHELETALQTPLGHQLSVPGGGKLRMASQSSHGTTDYQKIPVKLSTLSQASASPSPLPNYSMAQLPMCKMGNTGVFSNHLGCKAKSLKTCEAL